MNILAISTPVIITSAVVFLIIIILLVSILLYAKKKLTPQGNVTIDINEGEKDLEVESGQTLLTALASNTPYT